MDARCFPGAALANNKFVAERIDVLTIGASREIDHDSPVLIPGVDIGNHSPTANVTWLYNPEDCGLAIDDSYESGQQIWNNYGPKANEQRKFPRNCNDKCEQLLMQVSNYGLWLQPFSKLSRSL